MLKCFALFGQSSSLFWRQEGVLFDVEEEAERAIAGPAMYTAEFKQEAVQILLDGHMAS